MIVIDYNNARLVDILDCNGEKLLCWVDRESELASEDDFLFAF